MTEFKRVFIDTAPFIYLLDNDPNYVSIAMRVFEQLLDSKKGLVTSVITCAEYLIAPFRMDDWEKIKAFRSFIIDCGIETRMIDEETAIKAARIRAEYKNFKSMDALQLATACLSDCSLFLTNDKQLLQFREIQCVTLDNFFAG